MGYAYIDISRVSYCKGYSAQSGEVPWSVWDPSASSISTTKAKSRPSFTVVKPGTFSTITARGRRSPISVRMRQNSVMRP